MQILPFFNRNLYPLNAYFLFSFRNHMGFLEVSKFIKGFIYQRVEIFSRVEISKTRGQSFMVKGGKFKGGVRGKYFAQKVVGAWNTLPGVVVRQI